MRRGFSRYNIRLSHSKIADGPFLPLFITKGGGCAKIRSIDMLIPSPLKNQCETGHFPQAILPADHPDTKTLPQLTT